MSSIHRRIKSPYWHAAFTLPDGRRTLRSTGTSDRRKALKIAMEYERAAKLAGEKRLTEKRARDVLETIFHIANEERLPSAKVGDYLRTWLQRKAGTVAPASLAQYENTVGRLLGFLGTRTGALMDSIARRDGLAFRDDLAGKISANTVNKLLKISRIIWADAMRDGIARENVFDIKSLKSAGNRRRAFTMDEIARLLQNATLDWRGAILTGLYTGQRLGDIATLTWRQIDLETNEIVFHIQKTGQRLVIPMAKPLHKYFMGLAMPDDPAAPAFPTLAVKPVNHLSRIFGDMLSSIGFIPPRPSKHRETGRGHAGQRITNELSFHCLRHTATTLLKGAGASDVIARTIIGHASESVSRGYTHIETDHLRAAIDRLPEIPVAKE